MLYSQKTRARAETYQELRRAEKRLDRRKKEAWENQQVYELGAVISPSSQQNEALYNSMLILSRQKGKSDLRQNGKLEVALTKDDGQILPRFEETVRAIHRLKNHRSP